MWWRQEILMRHYKYDMHDFLEFRCFFGIYHETQEYPSPHQVYLLDTYQKQPCYHYDYKQCPFYLRYMRTDPMDPSSPYLLVEYDISHSHPLGLHIFHYHDLVNLTEIKRRSRVEYDLYEKSERQINLWEFRPRTPWSVATDRVKVTSQNYEIKPSLEQLGKPMDGRRMMCKSLHDFTASTPRPI